MENINWNLITLIVASIGTFFAGMSYINSWKEGSEKSNSKIREAFVKKIEWSNEGQTDTTDSIFFGLSIDNPNIHHFYGNINYFDEGWNSKNLVFYFEKIRNKNIYLNLRKMNRYNEHGLAKAKLKYINDDLFQIKFYKPWGFHHESFTPNLPRKTFIFPNALYDSESAASKILLTDNIIEEISPGRNYAKVKDILGISDKTGINYSIFEDLLSDERKDESAIADLYFLRNALLKVTTLDKESIYSITVFAYDSKITISGLFYTCEQYSNVIGEARICKEITDHAHNNQQISTIRDSARAIQNYTGAPFYKYITYFVNDISKDDEQLEGKLISGFCLSDGDMAFYIYDSELKG